LCEPGVPRHDFQNFSRADASVAAIGFATTVEAQRAPRAISQSAASQAAQQHPQIIQEFGGSETGARGAYVTNVGRRIASASGVPGASGAFTITTLNSPVMNAFAVPGGYVYIRGSCSD
jgi:predicted Zn-dependent protease